MQEIIGDVDIVIDTYKPNEAMNAMAKMRATQKVFVKGHIGNKAHDIKFAGACG